MASSGKSGKPLHPTNLHVNKTLFPNDTVQSRLPDPEWLERWLDTQIKFDKVLPKLLVPTARECYRRYRNWKVGVGRKPLREIHRHA